MFQPLDCSAVERIPMDSVQRARWIHIEPELDELIKDHLELATRPE